MSSIEVFAWTCAPGDPNRDESSTSHFRAIYSVEGDKLMFAFPRPKAQRPTSLERPVNADTVLVTFREIPSKS